MLCLHFESLYILNIVLQVAQGDDVPDIVENYYHNLTTVEAVCSASSVNCATQYVQAQFILSIPVNCSCGDPTISLDYGLFATYVVQPTDQLTTIASNFSVNADLISEYNSGVKSLVPYSTIFIPTRSKDSTYCFNVSDFQPLGDINCGLS